MGIKRVDIVAYRFETKTKYSFAGGHRHRYAVAHDDIHIRFPDTAYTIPLDIEGVRPSGPPRRRHDKGR
jgi:hypothetical protein